jgi:hypothetical protein
LTLQFLGLRLRSKWAPTQPSIQICILQAKLRPDPQANYGHKGNPPSSPPYFKCILSFTCPRYLTELEKMQLRLMMTCNTNVRSILERKGIISLRTGMVKRSLKGTHMFTFNSEPFENLLNLTDIKEPCVVTLKYTQL